MSRSRHRKQHPAAGPDQPQVVYVQAPREKRGMGVAGHGFNWTLTLVTCGMWIPFYWCWWACVRSWQAWRNHRNRNQMYG